MTLDALFISWDKVKKPEPPKIECAEINKKRFNKPQHGDRWPGGFFVEVPALAQALTPLALIPPSSLWQFQMSEWTPGKHITVSFPQVMEFRKNMCDQHVAVC
mgnify:CR=1 FL=1|jgi:hypothetical protein